MALIVCPGSSVYAEQAGYAHAGAGPSRPSQGRWLRFGVLPLQSPTKLAEMFMPLAVYLQDRLHRPVQFVTAPNFSTFMRRVAANEYDIVYLNPLLFAQAEQHGYRAVAKVAGEPFTGILVVRRQSPIRRVTPAEFDQGLTIGFPDPRAYAATVMTRSYLRQRGIDVDKCCRVRYFGSQDSALVALDSGIVDVAGTWWPSLRSMPASVRANLRVIAETPPQPQMPIALSVKLPAELQRKITKDLLALAKTPRGRKVLDRLGFPDGFAPTSNADYAKVK
ncbi:MAG: phosphate/phosphite/phosphonate ABC transporter substrate-binding protein [Acidihalobacter sp.]